MTNPKVEYNTFIRANLPAGMTYDEARNRYVVNNKYRFSTYLQAEWYLDYITKFGFSAGFDPATLFANGEEGAWYEPSTSTCFTDALGAVAATYGDEVQYLEDLSGNGNHATQATFAARPILARVPEGGRRNLLEYTEEFDNAYWTKLRATVTSNTDVAPNGTTTADTITATSTGFIALQRSVSLTGGQIYTALCSVQKGVSFNLTIDDASTLATGIIVDGSTGSFSTAQGGGFTLDDSDVSTHPDDSNYWLATISFTKAVTDATCNLAVRLNDTDTATLAGQGTSGASFVVWGFQLEEGSTATAYQKVVSEYDVTEDGVTSLDYLSFDGTDDGMATAAIDFTGTDKMSVFVGLEKANETDGEIVYELSSNWVSNNGAFVLASNVSAGSVDYQSASGGTLSGLDVRVNTGDNQPNPAVISSQHNISGDSVVLRVNGAQEGEATGDQGAGNFGNYPLNIGARDNATSLWFEGDLYGLIVRGVTSTSQEISDTESYLADKSGVTLP